MLIADIYNKLKSLYVLLLLILCGSLIAACNGSGSSSSNNSYSNGELSISTFVESNLLIGESTTATISIADLTSGESAVIAISNNNSSVISLTPNNCTLSAAANSCTVKVTAVGTGSATFSVSSTGVASVTSGALTISQIMPQGILFGTQNGMVFANDTLITGNSQLATIDYSQIFGFAIDSNGNMYAGTMGAIFGGFGAGKVFKYNSGLGYWTILAGTGAGGSLDGSQVNFLITDSANHLYAATNAGNVFMYANNVWSLMATTLNQPIKVLAFDANNNLYAGTNNGADVGSVFKYVNGAWVSLGSPDSTGIQSIAINSSGSIYAATAGNGGDGQVYHYTSGTSWTTISAFNDGSINALVINGSDLYAGTATGKVHKYAGSGTTWTLLGTPDATSSAVTAMTLSDSEIYAGTTGTNGDSTNGQIYHYNGTTWDQVSNLNNGYISAIVVYNGSLYTSTANPSFMNGMVYTYAANVWSPIGTGALDGTPVYSTTISSSGNLYAGTQNNVFKYLAANKFWILLGNLGAVDNSGVAALTTYESNVYAGTLAGNVFTTINGGSWQQIAINQNYVISGLLVSKTGQLYTSMNYNDPNDGNLKDGRVQKYNNMSGVWETLNGSAARHSVDGTPIQSITMDTTGNIYAATAGNGNGGFVWEYPVGSSAWVLLGTGTLDGTAINFVTTDSSLNVYVGTSAGNVFKYNGFYWIQINTSPLDTLGVSSLTIDHEGSLYATTYGGMVWMYINNTALWVKTKYGIGVSINTTGSTSF